MTYTADCLFPILTLVFPVIKRIDIVRSDDEDLEVLVREMGGRITTPFSEDDVFSFGDLNRFCLDNHPEIDGNIKCLSPLHSNQRHDMGDTTRRIFTDRNNLCWSVMADSSVVGRDRRLLSGVDEILSQPNNLPEGVELVQDGARLMVMMCLSGTHNFRRGLYKCVEM